MKKSNISTILYIIGIIIVLSTTVCLAVGAQSSYELSEQIALNEKTLNDYEEVLLIEKRWKTLRDTLAYAIEFPRIDVEHPSIARSLNPGNKNKQNVGFVANEIDFKQDNVLDMDSKMIEISNKEKTDKARGNINVLQFECFFMLGELEEMIENNETDYKLCYWTFDDGPYARTEKFLKRLDKYHIQATFFTTSINGKYCFDNKKKRTAPFYKKYIKYGHTIANHTYTHGIWKNLYDSKKNFVKAVQKQEDYVYDLTGYKTDIYRFPGGSLTAGSLKKPIIKELRKKGYAWVDWTAQTGDGGALKSTKRAYKNFKASMGSPIEVLLCHDYSGKTYKAMPKMIKWARKRNYIFAPLFHDSVAVNR